MGTFCALRVRERRTEEGVEGVVVVRRSRHVEQLEPLGGEFDRTGAAVRRIAAAYAQALDLSPRIPCIHPPRAMRGGLRPTSR
ncbi:hypothetical protein [Streptomyces mirabilis]|uniref:hypothetical protein n=1 Tax=Streptomyces mirabilis TaxID=68239 RepID=UPI00331C3328